MCFSIKNLYLRDYRARNAHEAFFRPTFKTSTNYKKVSHTINKRKPLTNNQRAAWAHAHYIIHHGSPADDDRFLKSKNTVDISSDARGQLRLETDMQPQYTCTDNHQTTSTTIVNDSNDPSSPSKDHHRRHHN